MNSMYRGEVINQIDFINKLDDMHHIIEQDLLLESLDVNIVMNALHTLASEIDKDEIEKKIIQLGLPKWAISDYIKEFLRHLDKEELQTKVQRELGEAPFAWKKITQHIEERNYPLGVLLHIGASNTLGLSAFSVIEGLLTGNINILKLPTQEGGISLRLLSRLVEIEPRLKPYLYVLDISSQNQIVIQKLIQLVNAVVVWGSDEAIDSIRKLTPPTISLIEYGHRLSFAYFTQNYLEEDLENLAKEIFMTDQLYCSSPQCVFLETNERSTLDDFSKKLSEKMNELVSEFPSTSRPMDVASQITFTHELLKMETLLGGKKIFSEDKTQYSVMTDYKPQLKPSPLFRHIWVMPIKRNELFSLIHKHKGHLQTVGLSCAQSEVEELSRIFYAAGINRITSCSQMSNNYSGEPHDGIHALGRYVRVVNRQK